MPIYVIQGKPNHPLGKWDDWDTFATKTNAERRKQTYIKRNHNMSWRVVKR